MKDGFYLSTYLFINDLAYLTNVELRHDMNLSLWYKSGNDIKLIKYWELERVTGLKQHRKAFYNVEQAKEIINQLLLEFNLNIDDINDIWGTPQIDTCNDFTSLNEYSEYCYHSICHLFSSLLADTEKFNNNNILSLAVDGVPDNVIDLNIEDKYYYTGCFSQNGVIKDVFPVASPGIHWGFIRDYFHLREGSLMALASASSSRLLNYSLKEILVTDKTSVSDVIDDVTELIKYVDNIKEENQGKLFTGFDPKFSVEDNKISMVVKEVQKVSEKIMCSNIEAAIKKYNINPERTCLAISGGFGLNCPCNSYVLKKYKFKDFIGIPCVNDSGMSLGIALYAFYKKLSNEMNFKFINAYYGENDEKLNEFREKYKDYIKTVDDVSLKKIVDDIIVAPIVWFNGNSEIGPRALGNRSLLADPRIERSKDVLNVMKQRQWWRPVAPVVLEEDVQDWFMDSYKTPFMLNTFNVKKDKLNKVPAIIHIDGSARVQTVDSNNNDELYKVVKAFKERTGVPILCNTSLNDKGEPIINTLDELFNFVMKKHVKVAYINGHRVEFKNEVSNVNFGICKRKIDFNGYLSSEEQKELLKKLNPYNVDGEKLLVFIQNPKLYDKIDLTKQSSIRILDGILKFRKNRFHVV